MLIRVDNVSAKVLRAEPTELAWLESYLSFRTKGRRGRPEVKSLVNPFARTFPAGLIDAVKRSAKSEQRKVDVVDARRAPVAADPRPILDWLRDYQLDAVEAARRAERGVFWHVTGAGKTEVMVGLSELYVCRWLIVVHRKELLHQTAERFAMRTGEVVGKLGDGILKPGRITVAMFQTLAALQRKRAWKPFFESVQGLMVDECHVLPASSFYRVTTGLPNAYYRYGFSGTPFARGDRKSVYTWGALGPILHEVRAPKLIEAGVLARPKVRMVPVAQLIPKTTWAEVYRLGIVESTSRNAEVCRVAVTAAKPCLLFVSHLDHGHTLKRSLDALGHRTEFVWGKAKTPVRRAAIRRLVHGDTDILICNVIFQEGVDIPELQSVVIAAGGKSTIAVLQDVGRGMRKRARDGSITKEEVEIYDFFDRGNRWLQRHARARMRAYAREQYPVVIDGGTHVKSSASRKDSGG